MNRRILFFFVCGIVGCFYTAVARCPIAVTADSLENVWALTAVPFKLLGEHAVCNVKVNWSLRAGADSYHVYRGHTLLGTTTGDTFDDYALSPDSVYTYRVCAYQSGRKIEESAISRVATFVADKRLALYDNLTGKYLVDETDKPQGIKIGDLYYLYQIQKVLKEEKGQKKLGWQITESVSLTGKDHDWSIPRELAFYPHVNFEGNAFQYNPATGKVVFSSHYEDAEGYTAAKIFLAQITPGGSLEVGTQERPLGYDSRDQSLFIDEDGTAYLLSATRMNADIHIYLLDESWTKPVKLINTVFVGQHRETPAIVKHDGVYYFFSSKASGWYPSQAMYAYATQLDGVWTPLYEIGNSSTFDAQVNHVKKYGRSRATFGLWSYHWGAQRKYPSAAGNFPRISVVSFHAGYASADYFRYVELDSMYGLIPVQTGRILTQTASVASSVANRTGANPVCVTDGADMMSSAFFQGSSYPYTLTLDLQAEKKVTEINLSTRLMNGSETAYKYIIEGSKDGKDFELLVDGKDNWQIGFLILPLSDSPFCRFLRLTVWSVVNVHNGHEAVWADGIYELRAFGFSK